MGYACPVCGHPQSDARHLANHLAFTALARGGDHETWLDDHVPDWESMDEGSLGERVTEQADETEFPQVFEDTTAGGGHEAGHARADGSASHDGPDHRRPRHDGDGGRDGVLDEARRRADGAVSDDADEVLERARELTRRRREGTDEESETE